MPQLADQIRRLSSGYRGMDGQSSAVRQAEQLEQELANARATNSKLVEALTGILTTVSLDWYVQQFARHTSPESSDTVSRVHNRETLARITEAFERARRVLQEMNQMSTDWNE